MKDNRITSGMVRDGKPRKYFTMSFDDGVTQDRRVTQICRDHNFYGVTFFINTGLFGANWPDVGPSQFGRDDVTHIRFTEDEIRTGIYDGFDVQVHTLHHPCLVWYDDQPEKLREEVGGDADNIKRIFGYAPVGMSWPGSELNASETTIKKIIELTDIRYSRCAARATHDFSLPEQFMLWYPSCSLSESCTDELAEQFLKLKPDRDAVFYVWNHAYELDAFDTYGRLERLIKRMSEAEDVICVSNTEFYELFKDEIPAY